jgi:hypothetical protein
MTPHETEAFEAARQQWNAEQDRIMAVEREVRKRRPFDLSPPRWYYAGWHISPTKPQKARRAMMLRLIGLAIMWVVPILVKGLR